jgi:hypothetical protein
MFSDDTGNKKDALAFSNHQSKSTERERSRTESSTKLVRWKMGSHHEPPLLYPGYSQCVFELPHQQEHPLYQRWPHSLLWLKDWGRLGTGLVLSPDPGGQLCLHHSLGAPPIAMWASPSSFLEETHNHSWSPCGKALHKLTWKLTRGIVLSLDDTRRTSQLSTASPYHELNICFSF